MSGVDSFVAVSTIEHIMNKRTKLAELRHSLTRHALPIARLSVPLGCDYVDGILGGGIMQGALHEVFPQGWSAGSFAVLLALLAAGPKALFWVRPDYAGMEHGVICPNGLLELGADPRRLVMVRSRNPVEALSAAGDILSCPHVGALLLEIDGQPKCLDLVASRRLVLAAEQSGVTAVMLRHGSTPQPSAAQTRWQVASAPSSPTDDGWGNPIFDVQLVRHRLGGLGRFRLQWNPEHGCFNTADTGVVAVAFTDRSPDSKARYAI